MVLQMAGYGNGNWGSGSSTRICHAHDHPSWPSHGLLCVFAIQQSISRPRSWYSLGKHDSASKQVEILYRSYSERLKEEVSQSPNGALARLSRTPACALSPRQAAQSKVQKYSLGSNGQCAVTVLPAACAIASHLIHVLPYVYSDHHYLLCFCGHLSNMAELADRLHEPPMHNDTGAATTNSILGLYKQLHGEKNEELLLSELQGHYAFFLFDSHNKQALAARDPSGEQELYYCVNPDTGSVSFTNSLEQLPPGEEHGRWIEVPPGHYVSGRTPVLHQFALTPTQLEARERNESADIGMMTDDDDSDASPRHSSTPLGLFASLSGNTSRAPVSSARYGFSLRSS